MQKLKLFPEDVFTSSLMGGSGLREERETFDMSPYTFMRTYFCFTDDCKLWLVVMVTPPSWCWCWWVRPQLSASEAARQTRYLAVSGDHIHWRFCLRGWWNWWKPLQIIGILHKNLLWNGSNYFFVEYFTLWPGAVGPILIQKSKFSSKNSSTKLQIYQSPEVTS